MVTRRFSHVVGIDDAPFERAHRGDVAVVGTVFSGARLEGVLSTRVRRDGVNATRAVADMIARSRFAPQLQLVMLQGIAVAGFNVLDLAELARTLDLPVLVVARQPPDLVAVRAALARVRGGGRKWRLIERAGPMEPCARVWVQRTGLSAAEAERTVAELAVHGHLPEPLRAAHIIAGGIARGESSGRP